MKSIALSILLAVTSAASYAAPELMVFNDDWGSPKSRAEVQAEPRPLASTAPYSPAANAVSNPRVCPSVPR